MPSCLDLRVRVFVRVVAAGMRYIKPGGTTRVSHCAGTRLAVCSAGGGVTRCELSTSAFCARLLHSLRQSPLNLLHSSRLRIRGESQLIHLRLHRYTLKFVTMTWKLARPLALW